MRFLVLILVLMLGQVAHSQSLFSLTPDTVFAAKPASTFTMYNYALFENLSGDSLAMRWVKLQTTVTQPGSHGGLGVWGISIQDPENFYNPASELDSADFVLPQTLNSSNNKFIMQLYPNGQQGTLLVSFKIFAINDPENFTILNFDYTVTPATTSSTETVGLPGIEISPNPVGDWLNIRNHRGQAIQLQLCSSAGQHLSNIELDGSAAQQVDMAQLPAGIYFLRIKSETGLSCTKFVKK